MFHNTVGYKIISLDADNLDKNLRELKHEP